MPEREVPCGRYTVTVETFVVGGSTRERPTKVVGMVPLNPVNGAPRGSDQPVALCVQGSSIAEPPLHNTVRGHIVGLDSLGGVDTGFNMVPMYSHFNISGYKTRIENWIKDNTQKTIGVTQAGLTLQVHYPVINSNSDPRIPLAFEAQLELTIYGASQTISTGKVIHPVPQVAYEDPVNNLQELIFIATDIMVDSRWWVEDHVQTNASARMADHEILSVPDKALGYGHRPYAVIDFLIFSPPGLVSDRMNALLPQITTGKINPDYQNGSDFSEPQKQLMYAVNLAGNNGYYKSDDPTDYVYKGKSHNYASFKDQAQAKSYRRDAKATYQSSAMDQDTSHDGTLVWNGGHQKPEVDHIVPKGKHPFGCNAYSNARIISSYLNNDRRTRR